MIECPCLVRSVRAFGTFHCVLDMFSSSGFERSSSLTNITPWTRSTGCFVDCITWIIFLALLSIRRLGDNGGLKFTDLLHKHDKSDSQTTYPNQSDVKFFVILEFVIIKDKPVGIAY